MSNSLSKRRGAVIVASIVALMGLSGLALAQVPTKPDTAKKTTKTTQQIKISKEKTAGGEVVPVPCEPTTQTVFVTNPARDDSIRALQYTLDSTANELERARLISEMNRKIAATEAAMREEAAAKEAAAAAALKRSLHRGFYFGIGGGGNAPQRTTRNGYAGGYNVTVPLGYDATDNPFGVRFDAAVDHMNGTRLYNLQNQTIAASGDITVWSANADLKLRIPTPGGSTRTHFYALGGVGAHKVTGGVYGTTDPNAGTNPSFNDAKMRFGWNAGGGAAIAWGPAEVFIESRFVQVKTDQPYHMAGGIGTYTSFTPVLIGIQWF